MEHNWYGSVRIGEHAFELPEEQFFALKDYIDEECKRIVRDKISFIDEELNRLEEEQKILHRKRSALAEKFWHLLQEEEEDY